MKNHYTSLGLEEGASQEEIISAYEKLSAILDPDKNDHLDFFIEEHALVVEAYGVLKKNFKKPKKSIQENSSENSSEYKESIESIFERYKILPNNEKKVFLEKVKEQIDQGNQNYKIVLNIIFKFENSNDLNGLFLKLSPKGLTEQVKEPTIPKEKDKTKPAEIIAVTDSDTSETLVVKYLNAPDKSKDAVLAMYKVLASMGNTKCILALHKLIGEPLELEENIITMAVTGIASNTQACSESVIPEGIGEFGLCKTNPVPVYGIPSNEIYLNQLKTDKGEKISWKRTGFLTCNNIEKEIDAYKIFNSSNKKIATLYLSPYHWKTSTKCPKGFININAATEKPSSKHEENNNIPNKNLQTLIPEASPKPSIKSKENKPKINKKQILLTLMFSLIVLVAFYFSTISNENKPDDILLEDFTEDIIPELPDFPLEFKFSTDTVSYKINQQFKLKFSVNKDATSFIPPPFEGVEILKGPIQNSKEYWVNGVRSYIKTYTYDVLAKKAGSITISPASIDFDGVTFYSDSLVIYITAKTPVRIKKPRKKTIIKNSEYYNNLGIQKYKNGAYKDALDYFSKASGLKPKEAIYYYNIGNTKVYLNDYDGACSAFVMSISYGYKDAQIVYDKHCVETNVNQKSNIIEITGVVTDHRNRILKGAAITNTSTNKKVFTNSSGIYKLDAKEGDEIMFYYRKYPSFTAEFDTYYGNLINVQLLKKRHFKKRVILKIIDSRTGLWSKTITKKK